MDASQRSKWSLFGTLCLVVGAPMALNDYLDVVDECLVAYALVALISATCGTLFVAWWIKQRAASEVYAWLTALLWAISFNHVVMFIARTKLASLCDYESFIMSPIWRYRAIPQVVIMLYLLSLIVTRMRGNGGDER